jgi:hypothetical protein
VGNLCLDIRRTGDNPWRRVDRTRRTVPQAVNMIRMRVRENDDIRCHAIDLAQPVGAAMTPGADVDIAARPKEP